MREALIARLKEGEMKLEAFTKFRSDPEAPPAEKKIVAFAELMELMAYSAILKLVPDYIPPKQTQIQVAQAFGGTTDQVTVVDGKVVVNPAVFAQLQLMNDLKAKQNGTLDKGQGPNG